VQPVRSAEMIAACEISLHANSAWLNSP
jgi:hypothetical protein